MPFNKFECSAFLDYVKASGLDFASKVPTQKEIQEGLDLRKGAYPGYLGRATAHHAETSAGSGLPGRRRDQKRRDIKDEDKAETQETEVEEGSQEV